MTCKSPRNVLVTGGGGFLGKAVVKRLIKRGDAVTSFCRQSYPELESMGVIQVQGDICDPEAVTNACSGMDIVFHVAAKPGVWGNYSDYFNTNVAGTENVIQAGRKHQVPILVHTSSPSVIFDGTDMEGVNESVPYPEKHHTHYTKTKAMAEKKVVAASSESLKTIILRPHLIWGPEDNHLVPRIIARAKKLVKVGNRDNLVDTIYIDNAADAHILAADNLEANPGLSGNIYFISQDEPIPVWEMINRILNAAGLDPITRSLPHRLMWCIGAMLEFIYMVCGIKSEPKMTRFVANELATAHWFDISAAKRDLGYRPKVSIEEGMSRLEEWLRKKNTL